MACSCGTMFVHSIHNQKIKGSNTSHGKKRLLGSVLRSPCGLSGLKNIFNKSKLVKKFWNNFHSAGSFESPGKIVTFTNQSRNFLD